ncbi:Fic family protein [Synoicihabitans lomoniglobus]|uniref:Fic family protein n=1 Tax=Synoicihabitans lomoniglobus TaxID=2909285 RepID=A0AAE9ZXC8_9BACT|nr:Fic family protein [Opitutaceae bacterium LMO-M01]WED64645.1 Fic family protein [Opitutaceae bacterium LMO-M01]
MTFNWQQSDWPDFRYDQGAVELELRDFADQAGQVAGLLKGLSKGDQMNALVQLMVAEAVKTSEIEGEYLSRPDVMSSVRHRLNLADAPAATTDRASAGAGELMVAVRESWDANLDEDTLFAWHRTLLPGNQRVVVGAWRTHEEPMQVISGAVGKGKLHFEAPPSVTVPTEMARFIAWFNASRSTITAAPVRAALVHLYFESIHPFEDGNGRIGRALAEKALSQGLGRPATLSLSRTIEAYRRDYYNALEQAQRSNEVTPWLRYFVSTVLTAQRDAETVVMFVLNQARFFDRHQDRLNDRQLRVMRRMLEAGPGGFEGGMNARKYISLTRASKATATRDLQALAQLGALQPVGAGRSARYDLNLG